ncbi:MAG: hypothetical protein JNK48_21995 [Bryobacterales bacterium]|nr:hypothetical protein [Bryobacterales bacterium]
MVAAEKMEFDGLLRRLGETRAIEARVRFAAEAIHHNSSLSTVLMVSNGPGRVRAAAACALDGPFDAVVSTGFCGGTNPRLRVGDIAVANEVRMESRYFAASSPESPKPAMTGPVVSQDRVACTAADKRRLGDTGAIAVEMEAAAVAAFAEQRGVPFYCIRVVSDSVEEDMPLDFNRYRTADGDFDRKAIAFAALRRPFSCIPALRRLQRNCQIASESLGAFLADCRF